MHNVSIVIPVYNEAERIGACLEAIARQTVRPYEVIVVDNNSTDSGMNIAHNFPFVRIVHEPRQGVLHARNRGFDAARGNIIGRIDADTILPATWVANVERLFTEHGANLALTGPCRFTNLPLSAVTSKLHDVLYYGFSRYKLGREVLFGSNMAISTDSWRNVRQRVCTSDKVHEDTDLAVHLPSSIVVLKSADIAAVALFRVPLTPLALWRYVKRWLYTLDHTKSTRQSRVASSRN